MPSSEVLENVTVPDLIVPEIAVAELHAPAEGSPGRLRLALTNHIKLLAFLVAVYALIFNKAMHVDKQPGNSPVVKSEKSSDQNVMSVSYIR